MADVHAERPYVVWVRVREDGLEEKQWHRVTARTPYEAIARAEAELLERGWPKEALTFERAEVERFGRTWSDIKPVWTGFHIAAAIAALVSVWVFGGAAYVWFVGSSYGVIVWLVGLPVAAYLALRYQRRDEVAKAVWLWFAVAILLGVGRTTFLDAGTYHHSNCWTISEKGGISIWECTPEGGEPDEWNGWNPNTDSGSSRFCTQINTSSSGGTIWRCEQEEF